MGRRALSLEDCINGETIEECRKRRAKESRARHRAKYPEKYKEYQRKYHSRYSKTEAQVEYRREYNQRDYVKEKRQEMDRKRLEENPNYNKEQYQLRKAKLAKKKGKK